MVMLDCFSDLRRFVDCSDWEAQFSRGDYLCRLGQRRTHSGQKLFVIHPEALDVQSLADEVALRQVDRQTTQPCIADEVSARRKHVCDRPCRRTTYGIKTERYWHFADCTLNRPGKVGRFDADEINPQHFNFWDKLGPPDNTNDVKVARFCNRDQASRN